MVRTPVARLPRLFRTRSEVPRIFSINADITGDNPRDLIYLEKYVVCMNKNRLDKAILMSTHNILLF